MNGLLWMVLAGVGWGTTIVVVLIAAVQRRRGAELGLRLRAHVEPYLRRRATELDGDPPVASDPTAGPEAIVDGICALADRLVERERKQVELGDTLNIGASDTMPLTPTPAPSPSPAPSSPNKR
jgi:hypothetical protein